jgi:Zn-dependent oligopeptidase
MDLERLTPDIIGRTVASAVAEADRRVDAAVAAEPTSFAAVIGALGDAALVTLDAFGRSAAFAIIHPDDDVRVAAGEADETLTKWRAGMFARQDVGRAVRRVAAAADRGDLALTDDERPAVDRWLTATARAGFGLEPAAHDEVVHGWARLAELGVRFQRAIEADRRTIELSADELVGLPSELIDRLEPGVTPGGRILSMDPTDRLPVLESSPNRALRERVVRTWFAQAVDANRPVLEEAVRIRRRIAGLLGFDSWMDLQTSSAMAGSRSAVLAFLAHLNRGLGLAVQPRVHAMTERLRADTGDPAAVVQEWDWRYYDALDRQAVGIDSSAVADYLPLGAVLEGLFELTADVFGIRTEEVAEARAWHRDVRRFRFEDVATGELLGEMLMDPFPRPGKLPGAWAYAIELGRHDPDGRPRLPLLGLVANLTPPGPDAPSLLSPIDLETLFHEFGHILEFLRGSSAQVIADEQWLGRDWIEAGSQIMEHWTSRPEIVGRFARHHRTGEPMPAAMLEALPATRRIGIETGSLRIAYMTMADVGVHGPDAVPDLDAVDRQAWSILPWPYVEGGFYPAQLIHLLANYDGLLYGYLWAQVYGDDMFSRFATEGTRSAAVGADYRREILEAPWTRPQVERLRRFLGREPSNAAFLERLGLTGAARRR